MRRGSEADALEGQYSHAGKDKSMLAKLAPKQGAMEGREASAMIVHCGMTRHLRNDPSSFRRSLSTEVEIWCVVSREGW